MKKFFHYIIMAALLGGTVPFASCNDDENQLNEWNMTYIYLLPADYLKPAVTDFQLTHSEGSGVEGSVEFEWMATASKAVEQDVTVQIDVTSTLPISADKINVSSKTAVIKAGSTHSEPISLSITDWSDLSQVKEAAEYTLDIKMTGLNTVTTGVTYGEFNQKFTLKISKAAEKPKEEKLVCTPQDWIFTFMEGVENANSNSVAGTGSADVATNGNPFWLTVDLRSVNTVGGIQTKHWGSTYCPTKVEVFCSDDGEEWISLGQYDTKGSTQDIKFAERVNTRFLKYQMIEVPDRVDITKFSVYMYK